MTRLSSLLLASTAGLALLVGPAAGQTTTNPDQFIVVGSTLPPNFIRVVGDCWGVKSVVNIPTTNVPRFTRTVADLAACAGTADAQTTVDTVRYYSIGSGGGIAAFIGNEPSRGNAATGTEIAALPLVMGSSEIPLSSTQAVALRSTGASLNVQSNLDILNSSGTGDPDAVTTDNVPNFLTTYGPAIQVPALVSSVTLAYNPTYNGVNTFNRPFGQVRLSREAYCGIFNGVITDWLDPTITAAQENQSVRNAADAATSIPLQIVGRSDSSGTTSIFTRHIDLACDGVTINGSALTNNITASGVLASAVTSAARFDATGSNLTGTETLGRFTLAPGNEGVSETTARGEGRLGYMSPDFVLRSGGRLEAALLSTWDSRNEPADSRGRLYVSPDPANVSGSLAIGTLPTLDRTQAAINAGTFGFVRGDVLDWVGGATASSVGLPSGPISYPIIGTSNFLLYTCYADADLVSDLTRTTPNALGFLRYWYTDATITGTALPDAGFVAVATASANRVIDTFLDGDDDGTRFTPDADLEIKAVGSGNCTGLTGAQ